jgi:hypothetical protein
MIAILVIAAVFVALVLGFCGIVVHEILKTPI